jgi:hypothetical protein
MKKINFEKLKNQDSFSQFKSHKLNSLTSSNFRGGTSTALCSTAENIADPDSEYKQENKSDSRCNHGY